MVGSWCNILTGTDMITIIDYGVGNLNSVAGMIRHIGGECTISQKPSEILSAEKLVLPGVGSFDAGINALKSSGLFEALNESVLARKTPILGICLGMQLMLESSEEGSLPGLGWIKGRVVRFKFSDNSDNRLKIPHMGWNSIEPTVSATPPALPVSGRFYFVHSYHAVCAEEASVAGWATHGYRFAAAVGRDNIFGVQFHPEKSHKFGMELFRKFLEWKC